MNIAEYLITTAQVQVNIKDRWSRTPLDEAYIFGHTELADYLVQNGGLTGSELATPPYSHGRVV